MCESDCCELQCAGIAIHSAIAINSMAAVTTVAQRNGVQPWQCLAPVQLVTAALSKHSPLSRQTLRWLGVYKHVTGMSNQR